MSHWQQVFGDRLISKEDGRQQPIPSAALADKHVAIYFSAHWCPPCRGFTPRLAETYRTLQKKGKKFEVVFVSMDRNQAAFDEYFGTMPWCAVPYQADQLRSVLSRKFDVQGIPALVLLGPDGKLLNPNARSAVDADPQGEAFPWPGNGSSNNPRFSPIQLLLLIFLIVFLFKNYLLPQAAA